MPGENDRPDTKRFLSDPKFQQDRDFFRDLHAHYLEEGLTAAAARRKTPVAGHTPNIFDRLAGLFGSDENAGDGNVFDRWFGSK